MERLYQSLLDPNRETFRKLLVTAVASGGRREVKTYRDYPLPDGTARYDDVWGA